MTNIVNDFTFAQREEGFDRHIEMSIRGYEQLHSDVVNFSRYFVENDSNVIDIGCSTGKTIEAMVEQNKDFAPNACYVGYEISEGFSSEMKKRQQKLTKKGHMVNLHLKDASDAIIHNANLVTSLFTLQFMTDRDRKNLVNAIYEGLNTGGAFVFAEKTLAESSKIQDMLTFMYYDFKRKTFDDKDILEKELTLRNMLKPMAFSDIMNMLTYAGFSPSKIQPFWQNHLFVGVVALK